MRRLGGVLVLAAALGGCGSEATGDDPVVRIYSSEVLSGGGDVRGSATGNNDLVQAEQLALREAGGRAGRFRVELKLLDETSTEGPEAPPTVKGNARRAVKDPKAVAFMGNSTSQWTVEALPITNRAGLLQVAPTSTYMGLTQKGLSPDEPGRYRPSGRPNFARVIANDEVQAGAIAEYLEREGVRRAAVYSDLSLYGRGLRALVLERLKNSAIEVVDTPAIRRSLESPAGLARALKAERVDGLAFLGAVPASVIRAFADEAPGIKVFLGDQGFGLNVQDELGDAARVVHITGPAVDAPQAAAYVKRFRKQFGTHPDPQSLGAYETMKALLAAIEQAGEKGDDREAVRRAFFALERKESVFGPYRIKRNGDATIRRYGLYGVRDRRIVLVATVNVP